VNDAGPAAPSSGFRRDLGLFDATMIVAGSMIGSGIFIVSADIARLVQTPFWLMAVWVATGLLTVVAALASGELAGMFPHAGGQYVYLREAFGPLTGFLYGWTLFLVIQTGTIAAVAVAFAKFLGVIAPWVSANNRLVPLAIGGHDLSITSQRFSRLRVNATQSRIAVMLISFPADGAGGKRTASALLLRSGSLTSSAFCTISRPFSAYW